MFRNEVAIRPLLVWLFCAFTAPAVQLLAGGDFRLVALVGGACTAVLCVALYRNVQWPLWACGLQIIWLILVLAECSQFSAESWPMGNGKTIVPLVLLGLAAWSAQKGPVVASRLAGVLFVLMVVGYTLVLGAGLAQAEWKWMLDERKMTPELAVFVFLLPGAAACIPRKNMRKMTIWLVMLPVFAVLATLATAGNVTVGNGFYEMCRSLSLFGLAERFEALVCALITVGWFALLSLLLSALGAMMQRLFPGRGIVGIWLAAVVVGAMVLGKMHMEVRFLALGAVIFWGLLPIISQLIGLIKNSRKK